ncbi:MAG: hypothetical protein RL497_3146 [Pseudomonadota bacterium]|jgi:hypothetical protein
MELVFLAGLVFSLVRLHGDGVGGVGNSCSLVGKGMHSHSEAWERDKFHAFTKIIVSDNTVRAGY